MKTFGKKLGASMLMLAAFVLWTVAICLVDVQAIGPEGSSVGFAGINGFVHNLTGVHMALYTLTDWLGLVLICFVLPAILCWTFGQLFRKMGWIKENDLKLDL